VLLLDYAASRLAAGIGAWRRDTDHIEKAFLFGRDGGSQRRQPALVVHAADRRQ